MKINSKKGYVFVPMVVIFSFFILLTAFIVLSNKYSAHDSKGMERIIGQRQSAVFDAYQSGENARLYLGLSAKFASEKAVSYITENASLCGNYLGYNVWSNRLNSTSGCIPDAKKYLKDTFEDKFNENLNTFLKSYPYVSIPQDNYDFSIDETNRLSIIGIPQDPIDVIFGTAGVPVCTGGDLNKLKTSILENCSSYTGLFSSYLQKNNLARFDVVLTESIAYGESLCQVYDPTCKGDSCINAGGIMQVDNPCFFKRSCPTVDIQIDEGTKELSRNYEEFKELQGENAVAATLFAYNRGTDAAKKAQLYFESKASPTLKDALYKACVEDFLPGKSTDYPGKTWAESYPLRKAANPQKYKWDTPQEYYCSGAGSGADYPYRLLRIFQRSCNQIGGEVSISANTGGDYTLKLPLKAELNYSFDEFLSINSSLSQVSDQILKRDCSSKSDINKCAEEILSKQKDLKWSLHKASSQETNLTGFEKNELRVDVQSKYHFMNASGQNENYVYKIAFFIRDNVPPKQITDIKAMDTLHAENSINISFAPTDDNDIDYYNIYYSEKEFTKADISDSSIKFGGKVAYDSTKKSYSQNTSVQDGTMYFFAVTPVDNSGNENIDVITAKGMSVDDLNPGPVEKIELVKKPGGAPIYDVTVTPPKANEDGSTLNDLDRYTVYIKTTSSDSCSVSDIASTLSSKAFTNLIIDKSGVVHLIENMDLTQSGLPSSSGTKYCVVVIAEDEAPDSSISSSRYSQNSIAFLKI